MCILGVIDALMGTTLTNAKYGIAPLALMGIAAGASAAANYGGMALQGAQGKKSQKRQFEYNSQMLGKQEEANARQMALQNKYQKEMYDYTFEKEAYANQVAEMKKAGLNVGMMYGGAGGLGGGKVKIGRASCRERVSSPV